MLGTFFNCKGAESIISDQMTVIESVYLKKKSVYR